MCLTLMVTSVQFSMWMACPWRNELTSMSCISASGNRKSCLSKLAL